MHHVSCSSIWQNCLKYSWKGKNYKSQNGVQTHMTYKFLMNALTHCAMLLGYIFFLGGGGSHKIKNVLDFILIGSTQHGGVPYHLTLASNIKIKFCTWINVNVSMWQILWEHPKP